MCVCVCVCVLGTKHCICYFWGHMRDVFVLGVFFSILFTLFAPGPPQYCSFVLKMFSLYTEYVGLNAWLFAVFNNRRLVLCSSIEPYKREQDFSMLFGKYWSKLQTVRE